LSGLEQTVLALQLPETLLLCKAWFSRGLQLGELLISLRHLLLNLAQLATQVWTDVLAQVTQGMKQIRDTVAA
jgi:hypothetical protein